jgi:hypothetical protein
VSDARRRGEGEREERESTLGRYSWLLLVGLALALVFSSWVLAVAILGLAFLILVHEFGHFVYFHLSPEERAGWDSLWNDNKDAMGEMSVYGLRTRTRASHACSAPSSPTRTWTRTTYYTKPAKKYWKNTGG